MAQSSVDLTEILEFIARRYGLESFNSDEFIDIIEDLTPYMRREARILRRIENTGVISALVAADLESEAQRIKVINEVLRYLIDEEAFDQGIASEYIRALVQSFGWRVDPNLFAFNTPNGLPNFSQQVGTFDQSTIGNSFNSYSSNKEFEKSQVASSDNFNPEEELGFSYIEPEPKPVETVEKESNDSFYPTFDPFKEAALMAAQQKQNYESESDSNIPETKLSEVNVKKQKVTSKKESTFDPFKTFTEPSLEDNQPVEPEEGESRNLTFESAQKQEEPFIKLSKSSLSPFDSDTFSKAVDSVSDAFNTIIDDENGVDTDSSLEQIGEDEELDKDIEKIENLDFGSFNSDIISQITNNISQNVFHHVPEESSKSDDNLSFSLDNLNENSIETEPDDSSLSASNLEAISQMGDLFNHLNNTSSNIDKDFNSKFQFESLSCFNSSESPVPVEEDLSWAENFNQAEDDLSLLYNNIDNETTEVLSRDTIIRLLKEGDPEKLAQNLQTFYLAGAIEAQPLLFRMHRLGYGMPKSDQNAFEMVKLNMSETPDPIAAYLLAECYLNGIGVQKDPNQAEELFSIYSEDLLALAYDGMGEASFLVAQGYEHGNGFEKNWNKALRWYRNGVFKNSVSCRIRLGMAYLKGEGIKQNAIRGRLLLEEAYDPEAWMTLAKLYQKGELLPKDLDKANTYISQAAKCGYLPAKTLLENQK